LIARGGVSGERRIILAVSQLPALFRDAATPGLQMLIFE
jgi:hypothetical protein